MNEYPRSTNGPPSSENKESHVGKPGPLENSFDEKTVTASSRFAKRLLDQWGDAYLFEIIEGACVRYVVHDGARHWEFAHLLSARRKFKRQASKQGRPIVRK
jgi:hypothetical protein